MTDDPTIDRRTVLKTTGAALGGVTFAAGSASAYHCRVTNYDAPAYDDSPDSCFGEQRTTIPEGVRGKELNTCGNYVAFYSNDDPDYWGWVHVRYLDEC